MTQEQALNKERARVTKIILQEIDRWKTIEASNTNDQQLLSAMTAIGALSNVLAAVLGINVSHVVEVDGVVRGHYKNADTMAWHFSEFLKSHDAMKKELEELRGKRHD